MNANDPLADELGALETPALLVDGPILLENIASMAARTGGAGVELWPHTKTHKSTAIAGLQVEHGARGLTVATITEAEAMARAGFQDILIAYPPVGEWRLRRITQLAATTRLRVVLDDGNIAHTLDDACRQAGVEIAYLWEIECGTARCGSLPEPATAETIARVAEATRHARFDGLMAFAGFAYAAGDADGIQAAAADEGSAVRTVQMMLAELGVEARTTSVGTTPTTHNLDAEGPISEARPGNYVFYDATQVALGLVPLTRCALSVLGTVVSRPDPRRLIADTGSKSLSSDRLTSKTAGYGTVVGHPELNVHQLYEEHAIVTSKEPCEIPIGARIRIVPNHACTCLNLHQRIHLTENGVVADVWEIDARGWTSRNSIPAPR
jgi:D-serine deaminase-like pyridoxal phosphate-dependent protein